jgi:hypothetical protein
VNESDLQSPIIYLNLVSISFSRSAIDFHSIPGRFYALVLSGSKKSGPLVKGYGGSSKKVHCSNSLCENPLSCRPIRWIVMLWLHYLWGCNGHIFSARSQVRLTTGQSRVTTSQVDPATAQPKFKDRIDRPSIHETELVSRYLQVGICK